MSAGELSAVRDELHGTRRPAWMNDVLVTGIGPKLVRGEATGEQALHFLVPNKRPLSALALDAQIPAFVGGMTTDVLGAYDRPASEDLFAPSALSGVGFGTSLIGDLGDEGIAACAVKLPDGRPALITSAHVLAKGEEVFLPGAPPKRLGTVTLRLVTARSEEIYPRSTQAPSGPVLLDVAAIALDEGIHPNGGLPGRKTFTATDVASRIQSLVGSRVVAWGQGGFRRGIVRSFWPRRVRDDVLGLCLVQQSPTSERGDSGGLWLLGAEGGYAALGLHWGQMAKEGAVFAMVTDMVTGARLLGLGEVFGAPRAG
jgi:hypothetical protein